MNEEIYISARQAAYSIMLTCVMSMAAIIIALWVIISRIEFYHGATTAQIKAKSEMTAGQIKQHHVMQAKPEKRHG